MSENVDKQAREVIYKDIGDAIRARRKLLRMSQEDVAFTLGFPQNVLSKIELGKNSNVGSYLGRLEKHLEFKDSELSSLLK